MESTTHSVQRAPAWNQAGTSAPASASDPLAFFDLIMSTAQKMSAQGGERNHPLAATAPQEAPNQQSATAHDSSSSWQDDRRHDEPSHGPLPTERLSGTSSAATETEAPAEGEDAAAVAEFSEQPAEDDQQHRLPDDAALATAGAAGQEAKLLGAPDPLAAAEESALAAAETEATDAGAGKRAAIDPLASDTRPEGTDVPLDTSVPATQEEAEAANRRAVVELDAQQDAASRKMRADEKAEHVTPGEATEGASPAEDGDVSLEEKTSIDAERQPSRDIDAESKVAETAGDTASDNAEGRESRQEGDASGAVARSKSSKPKPTIAEAAQTTSEPTPQTSESAPVQNKADAVAAAATATASAPQAGATRGSAGSSDPGTTGITSLLQRGLQRGTLQKAADSKPATGLDPKQQVRLVNRVARAVETTPPGQAIRIRLNPSELGALKVEIKIENGNMTARIEAENPATRQVLLENLPQLRERLAESNIQVQQFEVDLMGQESPNQRDASPFPDDTNRRHEGRSSGESSAAQSNEKEGDREVPGPRTVNKQAEHESRNLNVTV